MVLCIFWATPRNGKSDPLRYVRLGHKRCLGYDGNEYLAKKFLPLRIPASGGKDF